MQLYMLFQDWSFFFRVCFAPLEDATSWLLRAYIPWVGAITLNDYILLMTLARGAQLKQ